MDKKNRMKICKKCGKDSNEVNFMPERLCCNICRNNTRKNKPDETYFKNYYIQNREYILEQKATKYKTMKEEKKNNNIELIF